MSDPREQMFLQMVQEYPDSPMGHFSLGKHYLEQRRYAEAARALEAAVRLDATYAAAMVSLGDAYAGAGETQKAREVLGRARDTALAQNHASLAEEIEARLEELE
ncbi:MAG: tetratricopeptide repeat protein [Myxococcaceae bacterium]|nr:tetratricopeptide repeat protein [Myxococcaceae bacterium]MCI0670865.1 tetratricopeptide repeat protein [Myxococcaceae bacterium]